MSNDLYSNYFKNHGIDGNFYKDFKIPRFLKDELPEDKTASILDIGCGFGQFLLALKKEGFSNLNGVDIADEAIVSCRNEGLGVEKISDIRSFCLSSQKKYDFIAISHVIEHLEKNSIIETLSLIREKLMKDSSKIYIAVPNAQSNTGCYWAYEDFTHTTLFTAGSVIFVTRSAGFKDIKFLDPDGMGEVRPLLRPLKKMLLKFYGFKIDFWNRVTAGSFHEPSPRIYTFDLKCILKK